jgi:hypothetical protein
MGAITEVGIRLLVSPARVSSLSYIDASRTGGASGVSVELELAVAIDHALVAVS